MQGIITYIHRSENIFSLFLFVIRLLFCLLYARAAVNTTGTRMRTIPRASAVHCDVKKEALPGDGELVENLKMRSCVIAEQADSPEKTTEHRFPTYFSLF